MPLESKNNISNTFPDVGTVPNFSVQVNLHVSKCLIAVLILGNDV
jgi:hypothetical protein